ncbi:orotidine 5'-phosphate decarboxylase PyrF [Gottschalkia acidurici 9a]|uniref:Orotidine 5'-phosphate decarboxylase n=1 Tax=Gottschalkia acidurici (strain ATCC 7906 / DSM 604 / BCRC 14475 / CIP 104303 / KCTC 5404 / NCIMB 10678 / 9a) TaxID=1128398 RepID=K0AV94_GOTA9|nr:orotidine-5'-phosphate decarboxylase [Gottschalkia acidurici]AFS77778.1 orotidine 5'-phosphate decarboxylase PyrF [Gottschalkia acidurici 9a]
MIIDKLFEAVEKKGHVCVGLDTDISYIPEGLFKKFNSISDAIFEYNRKIIDATLDASSCFKVQIAYYEAYGLEGIIAYKKTLEYLRSKETIIIADIKRGDISKTAEMYAKGHFEGDFESDFITLSPYMGIDSIEPYLEYVKNNEKGLFPLIRTSNQGAKDIQYIKDENGERIFNVVGKKIQQLGDKYLGNCGYSSIGGVVGCTHREEAVEIRNTLDRMFFLIPGYGAQGGAAEDVKALLKDGNGGVVNSSRGILLAYKKHEDGAEKFDIYAREEAISMREAIRNVI